MVLNLKWLKSIIYDLQIIAGLNLNCYCALLFLIRGMIIIKGLCGLRLGEDSFVLPRNIIENVNTSFNKLSEHISFNHSKLESN